MTTKTTERENLIAEFKKEFFANVKIDSRTKGTGHYRIIHKNGRRESSSAENLLKQNETRFLLLRPTDQVMPSMNRSEYIGFVQDVMENTSVIEEW
jgi:hypothetical protein